MINDWKEIKWIFEEDGSLRDILAKDINLTDWGHLFDYLNDNHSVKYGIIGENNLFNKIDKNYLIKSLDDSNDEIDEKTISVIIDHIIINIYFFTIYEIEFDIDPNDIKSFEDYLKIINFMNQISKILGKPLILTGENQSEFPLIKVDSSKNLIKALTKTEAEKLWK